MVLNSPIIRPTLWDSALSNLPWNRFYACIQLYVESGFSYMYSYKTTAAVSIVLMIRQIFLKTSRKFHNTIWHYIIRMKNQKWRWGIHKPQIRSFPPESRIAHSKLLEPKMDSLRQNYKFYNEQSHHTVLLNIIDIDQRFTFLYITHHFFLFWWSGSRAEGGGRGLFISTSPLW
jgi:hypothetical protein